MDIHPARHLFRAADVDDLMIGNEEVDAIDVGRFDSERDRMPYNELRVEENLVPMLLKPRSAGEMGAISPYVAVFQWENFREGRVLFVYPLKVVQLRFL